MVQSKWRLILDGEVARDGERSHRVKRKPYEVVEGEGEGEGATVGDARGAHLGVGEAVFTQPLRLAGRLAMFAWFNML